MNPPFTRSVGGNLLFGTLPDKERAAMQKKLRDLLHKSHTPANATAGLGSVFVAAAHPYIKPGGRMALVLPKSLLSGIAWGPTRSLLRSSYQVEHIIASHDPGGGHDKGRWHFSENTDLSEVLVVARKTAPSTPPANRDVVAVNLWRNPTTAAEALALAHSALRDAPPHLYEEQGALDVCIGTQKIGEAVRLRWDELRVKDNWMLLCAFAQSDLTRVAGRLTDGHLWLPGHARTRKLHLTPLMSLGTLGPDRRDIHDGFKASATPTAYPAFWGHDAEFVTTIEQDPNRYLSPLRKAKKGRPLRMADVLWPRAGSILLAERLWLNTQKVVAARLPHPVLSNMWWPLSLNRETATGPVEKMLVLWLNSTLGLLVLLACREETRGAWVDFKKPTLEALPVLDPRRLTSEQAKKLLACYNRVCRMQLRPLSEMASDDVRADIDRSIASALRLPDFSILRTLLAQEPVVCLRRL